MMHFRRSLEFTLLAFVFPTWKSPFPAPAAAARASSSLRCPRTSPWAPKECSAPCWGQSSSRAAQVRSRKTITANTRKKTHLDWHLNQAPPTLSASWWAPSSAWRETPSGPPPPPRRPRSGWERSATNALFAVFAHHLLCFLQERPLLRLLQLCALLAPLRRGDEHLQGRRGGHQDGQVPHRNR